MAPLHELAKLASLMSPFKAYYRLFGSDVRRTKGYCSLPNREIYEV